MFERPLFSMGGAHATIAALALSMTAAGCGHTESGSEAAGTSADTSGSLPNQTAWANGTNWTYESGFAGLPNAWVYRPASFSKKSPNQRAAIFHLVGCGELPYQVAQGSGWAGAAEAYGMVVVIPEIVAPSHPNGPAPNVACYDFGGNFATQPTRNSPDHKALITAGQRIVSDSNGLQIDPRQVYLTGLSAGATVAMQVACMAPDIFAGVGSVAGPAMGTDQSSAVMPPKTTSDQVRSKCTSYAQGSPAANASSQLANQVYAIMSDDNGLPAGNPVFQNGHWTADKFADQTYWDGDKYVPHAYHVMIADAMATIFQATKTGSQVNLPFSGTGVGCRGGENSHDDTGETQCNFADAVSRSWQAKADVWTDSQGRQRIVQITQDTLRHRWPVGTPGALDKPVTPDKASLVSNGYVLSSGQFDLDAVNAAPNGALGILFFANDSFSFAMYLADFVNQNNPRLPR
jgi:poly(hydroxyalkanoate) depolymerase family esterase